MTSHMAAEIAYLCKFPSYLHTRRGPKCRFSCNVRVTDGNETTWEMQKIKESRKRLCPGLLLALKHFQIENEKDALFVSFWVRYGRRFSAISGTWFQDRPSSEVI